MQHIVSSIIDNRAQIDRASMRLDTIIAFFAGVQPEKVRDTSDAIGKGGNGFLEEYGAVISKQTDALYALHDRLERLENLLGLSPTPSAGTSYSGAVPR